MKDIGFNRHLQGHAHIGGHTVLVNRSRRNFPLASQLFETKLRLCLTDIALQMKEADHETGPPGATEKRYLPQFSSRPHLEKFAISPGRNVIKVETQFLTKCRT